MLGALDEAIQEDVLSSEDLQKLRAKVQNLVWLESKLHLYPQML